MIIVFQYIYDVIGHVLHRGPKKVRIFGQCTSPYGSAALKKPIPSEFFQM